MIDLSIFKTLAINGTALSQLSHNGIVIWKKQGAVIENEYRYEQKWMNSDGLNDSRINGTYNQDVYIGLEYKNANITYTILEYKKGTFIKTREIPISRTINITFSENNIVTEDGDYYFVYHDTEYNIDIMFVISVIDVNDYNYILTYIDGSINYSDLFPYLTIVVKLETTNRVTSLPANHMNSNYWTNQRPTLKEVVISSSVKSIADDTFSGFIELEKITFLAPTPPTMTYSFAGAVKANGVVYVPQGSYDAYYAILNDWHGASLTSQGWTIEELPAGEIISTVYEFYDIESPTVNATDTSCDITYSYKEIVSYDSGITKEKIYEFVHHVTFDENTNEDDIEITGSFVSEFGDTINYTITQTGASSSGGGDVVLDWGTDSNVSYITPDPATRSYATALTDNMAIGPYAKLRFTRPDKAAESGYYGDGIDGLIKCVTYNTTSATYAGDTNVIGNKSLLTTWKNNGAKVTMAYVDKAFSRYGNDFIFAGPSGVNVLGFCVLSGHVADNIRYDRYIIVNAPNTTTADGRHALRISNGEFYSGSSYGYIVAVIYS